MSPNTVSNKKSSKVILDVLHILCSSFSGISEAWAITGSGNLVIRDCYEIANDIDIITTRIGAIEMSKHISNFVITELSYSELKDVRSHFLSAKINGIVVEIMGSPVNRIDQKWIHNTCWKGSVEYLNVEEMTIPAMTLEYERSMSRILGNSSRADDIEKFESSNCR